jgi:VanZ family protein
MKLKPLIPAIVWASFILAVIIWPGSRIPDSEVLKIPMMDKAIHFVLFFVLANLLAFGLFRQHSSSPFFIYRTLLVLISGILYGAATELLQYWFLSSRHGNAADLLANIFGMVFGLLFYRKVVQTRLNG